jgi:ankyrin repeat domain-containing protein 50
MVRAQICSNSLNCQINKSVGYRTVQVMHQTVREFFLDPDGPVAESEFAMYEKDAHVCISITCIRYLMLCAANISTEELPDINRWASKHFKDYAQRLDEKPLANYALCHLKDHIDGCQGDANVQNIVSQFIGKLNHNPAVYLLEGWVNSCLNKILLRIGEATAATDFKNKVLHTAVRNGLPTAAEMLLTAGANVNERDQEGRTPLSWAAEGGHQTVVKLLLETGKADVDSRDHNGRTPLSMAAEGGHQTVIKLLLETGRANVDPKGNNGRTPLSMAAERGHQTVVKLLLETSKADVDSKDHNGRTPLSLAAEGGHEAVVKLLLQTGKADVESEDYNDRTPLSFAEWRGHDAVVRLLMESQVMGKGKERFLHLPPQQNLCSDSSSLDSSPVGSFSDEIWAAMSA